METVLSSGLSTGLSSPFSAEAGLAALSGLDPWQTASPLAAAPLAPLPSGGDLLGLEALGEPSSGLKGPSSPVPPGFVADELLVQFRAGTSAEERRRVRGLISANLREEILTAPMQRSGLGVLERVQLPGGLAGGLDAAIAALERHPLVAFAERNLIARPAAISNDPYYTNGNLWGLYSDDSAAVGPAGTTNPFGIQAEQVWRDGITGSDQVVVGIIDEGIQVSHPDLVDNIWVNPGEIAGNQIDDDGNGFIDDIHGWDFVSNNNSVYDVGEDAHGTHVAGTIGGRGGNGMGVAGVNWDVTLISAKFLGPSGGTLANAVKAIDYLTDLKVRQGINLVAMNNSWGGGGYSQSLHDAIIRAAREQILFVAAAGNSSSDNDTSAAYPASYNTSIGTSTQAAADYDAVIAVASITSGGALSSFSSYGASSVDLGAPGSGVWSSVPTNSYAAYDGTSMATPHVTGAAALYASAQAGRVSAASIKAALLESATPTASLSGRTISGGRLNIQAALQRSTVLSLDRDLYNLPESISVTLQHPGADRDGTAIDSVAVQLFSTSESVAEELLLQETAPASGRFTGTIALSGGAVAADGALQASDGDLITLAYGALGRTDTARVDTRAPSIDAVTATARALSCELSWSSDEASSSEVLYGLSPTDLNTVFVDAGLVSSHRVMLRGLTPSSTYHYQLRSRDRAGNVSTDPTIRSFTTAAPAPILLVDDDRGAEHQVAFADALTANGYGFDSWDTAALAAPPTVQELSRYDTVLWTTGYDYSTALTSAEQAAIGGYLDGGGKMFLSSQDALWNGVSSGFRTSYLKVASYSDDVRTVAHTETGVAGHPVSSGLSLAVAAPVGFGSLFVDALTPSADAQGMLLHGVSTASSPYSAVSFRSNSGFAMVFSTMPFEAVSRTAADPNNQKVLLRRIVDFLHGNAAPAGISVSTPTALSTSEGGGSSAFSVVLASQPTQTVRIPVAVSNSDEARLSSSELVFSTSNWNVAQWISVSGVDDAIDDGNVAYSVVLGAASSADGAYNGLDPADVALTNSDDDTAGISVTAPSGTSTSEAGGTVTFSVRLNSQPRSSVTLPISSSNSAEGMPDRSLLTFSAADWNVAQTVTVSGVDDAVFDGDRSYSVLIGAASSSDGLYGGLNPADISLTNLDNDAAPATKFFVLNDGASTAGDLAYQYSDSGTTIGNRPLAATNPNPRGAAMTAAADRIWVVDRNRIVHVYQASSGALLTSWTAGTISSTATVEGIATDGIDVWIVDARSRTMFRYAGAAAHTAGGTLTATSSVLLDKGNANPRDVVYGSDGSRRYLWVVNDASTDRVYRYVLGSDGRINTSSSGADAFSSWALNSASRTPTGIALDPSQTSGSLWVVDISTDRVYAYGNGRSGTSTLTSSFALAPGNTEPQAIADPPVSAGTRQPLALMRRWPLKSLSPWAPANAAQHRPLTTALPWTRRPSRQRRRLAWGPLAARLGAGLGRPLE